MSISKKRNCTRRSGSCNFSSKPYELETVWLPIQIALHSVQLPLFISSILRSLVILAMWLVLSGPIYSQIALSFALNRITNQISRLFFFKTNQSHYRKMKDKRHSLANLATFAAKTSLSWKWINLIISTVPKSCSSCI